MKVMVTGTGGQLGFDVVRELERRKTEHIGVDLQDFDITDRAAASSWIGRFRPDAVVHCSAYTAVDRAEQNEEECRRVNAAGTRNIAAACKEVGARMIYISTDYVFPGTGQQAYETDSPTGPVSVYGKTKLEGEHAVRACLDAFFIVRISWVFGVNGNNFVKTMLKLAKDRNEVRVVRDQVGSPTYTADLAPLLCDMLLTDHYGVYHATNEGVCSWAQFAEAIFQEAARPVTVRPILSAEYPTAAARPLNSRLCKDSLDRAGFSRLPPWRDALVRYLKELGIKKQRRNSVRIKNG